MRADPLRSLAVHIDPARAPTLLERYSSRFPADQADAAALAALVVTAYPAFEVLADARGELFLDLAREGWRSPRTRAILMRTLLAAVGALSDGEHVRARLRRQVAYEKLRIALRELLPPSLGGADVEVTAAELSYLAEASIEVALAEAVADATHRYGEPRTASGDPSRFVVLGMGKLGGRELNAGSDIDLLYFYDTDDGEVLPTSGGEARSLHQHWSQVARRLTETLDAVGEDGRIWRTDLRLRPEGSRGAITCSAAAAERYYETFGRLWERSALVRARPVAGDLALGDAILRELCPFVYVRHIDPSIATELMRLVERSRAELSPDKVRDLKLGRGGIREAETFVQTLQLIFGGKEPRVRATNTLDALARLAAQGLITEREASEVADGYLLLRKLEHRVQFATGLQTHLLPPPGDALARLARSSGYGSAEDLALDIERVRAAIRDRFDSLAPTEEAPTTRWDEALARLSEPDEVALATALEHALGRPNGSELARHLQRLATRPDDLLGDATRERFPELASTLLDALADAADPERAARYLRTWTSRLRVPSAYIRPLGENPHALKRLVGVLGASAFLGDAIANRPELGESVIFSRNTLTPELARIRLGDEVAALAREDRDDPDAFVGALRRGAWLTTIEVALADLGGEIGLRDAMLTLSALADATLEQTARFVMGAEDSVRGLAIVGLGKLGGNELGFGSDLDVLFVFDPGAAPSSVDPHEYFARRAQRIIRLVSSPHAEGRGYELDARLRPSGSHGWLVTSLDSFARYHGVTLDSRDRPGVLSSGSDWERQALVRARFCAGDPALGAAAMRVARMAAFERGAPRPEEMHRLRMRMQRELARERPGRHDLKYGRGALTDIEFAVQYLQMKTGSDPRVRTHETWAALGALEALGYLRAELADALREGYRFLRQLEQRIRIVHGSAAHLLDEEAEGLIPLARRMGLVDTPRATAVEQLLTRYRELTARVRRAYLEVLGVTE